jgi:hypothetical protein
MSRLVLWRAVFAAMVVVMLGAGIASADPAAATISLGRDPEPPMSVLNPGGVVDIWWNIQHTTTPNYVYFKLEDPTRTIIYDQQTYTGTTGITVNRQWTVPAGAPDGKYWIRVEYWSYQAGNEANAEVTFYVCCGQVTVFAEKWQDMDCDEALTYTDRPVADWWICVRTPHGDTFCQQTNSSGQVSWAGLPEGNYRVSEVVPSGWIPIYPTFYEFTLDDVNNNITLTFFNKLEGASAAEPSTWGQIKSLYR